MTDKEIIIDGVDVSGCDELWLNSEKNYDSKCIRFKDVYSQCSYCKDNPNCEYKQLQKEKFENLNNRQMVESAENLIYENSELIKNLKEKEKECDKYKQALNNIEEYFECKCKICRDKPELLDCSFCEHKTILDIINKAKDGNNDR